MLTEPGPYISAYLNVLDRPLPADMRIDAALSGFDVDAEARARIVEAVTAEAKNEGGMLAVVASATGRVVTATFPDPPIDDVVEQSTVPRLAPFIEADQSLVHHLIAAIDEQGLSLIAYPRHGDPVEESLSGGDLEGAATLIAHVAQRTDTSMVILCGRSQALDQVHPQVVRSVPITCPVTRLDLDPEASTDPMADLAADMVRAVSDRSARRVVEMLRIFRYYAAHGAAVDGVIASVDALRSGHAGILVLNADPDDDRQAWFGPPFERIAIDIEEAAPIDPERPLLNGRLVDVVLRSAVGQHVPVFIVPSLPDDRLADGIGVILKREDAPAVGLDALVDK